MRRLPILTALLLTAVAATAEAQSATQTVNYDIQPIASLAFSGTITLTINTATAGSASASVSSAGTYAISNNQTGRKITAAIDSNMPGGLTLTTTLAAVGGGTSAGAKTLSTTAVDVVNGIGPVSVSGQVVTYGLTATLSTAPVSGSRTVTYTIVVGP